MARGAVQAGGICTGDVGVMVADTAGWAWLRRWEAGGGLGGREDGPRTRSAWVCLASVAQRTERAPDRGERGCRPRSRWRRRSRWQASPRRRAARHTRRPCSPVCSPFFSISFLLCVYFDVSFVIVFVAPCYYFFLTPHAVTFCVYYFFFYFDCVFFSIQFVFL